MMNFLKERKYTETKKPSFFYYKISNSNFQTVGFLGGADTSDIESNKITKHEKTFKNNKDTITLNLNNFITKPGQYEVVFLADVAVTGTSIDNAIINFENQNTMQSYLSSKDNRTFYINRTSQVSTNSSSTLTLYMRSDNQVFQNRGIFKIRQRP